MSLLKVTNLGKSFGGVKAVDGISFELAAGELLALIGPNGAGKTTTFNMVNGQLKADVGSITLDGQELLGMAPRDIWRMGVSRTFQIAETFSSLTVVENVQMALLSSDRKLFAMWRRAADHKRGEALELLDQVSMKAQADRPCSVLAYGDVKRMQWVAFVIAGTFAGLAGALYAFSKGSISPESLHVSKSIDGLVMVLLGGVQTLVGPIVGAVTFTWLHDTVARNTDYWRAMLGAIILILVLLFPQGIAGFVKQLVSNQRGAGKEQP